MNEWVINRTFSTNNAMSDIIAKYIVSRLLEKLTNHENPCYNQQCNERAAER